MTDKAVETATDDPALADFGNWLRARRSIALFRPEVPPRALIQAAIEVACWAPNHHLVEPWRFYFFGPERMAALIDLECEIRVERKGPDAGAARRQRLAGIPGWLLLASEMGDTPLATQENYAATCCAAQNLMLYLWRAGVGTKWTTGPITRDPRLYELIGLDSKQSQIVGLFHYGYPKFVPEQQRRDPGSVTIQLP